MNALYDTARESFLKGELAVQTQEIRAVLVDTTSYTVDRAADNFLDDIPSGARVAVSDALTSVTTAAGVFDADDMVFAAVTGAVVGAVVLYANAPTVGASAYAESDAALIAYIDTALGLPGSPNGQDITITWDAGANAIFRL